MIFRKFGLCSLFLGLWCFCAHGASAPIGGPGPAMVGGGGNLTGFSGNMGSINNNQWNQMMNPGKGSLPTADFGNCNAVVIRCASPKCPGGGCATMEIARPIVNGCVQSNPNCKQYGDALVDSIAAQLTASANAKAQEAENQANAAAASAAAAQSSEQMAAMQAQMQQMQAAVAASQQESNERLEAALAEQQRIAQEAAAAAQAAASVAPVQAAPAYAGASVPTAVGVPTDAAANAASMGISADVLAREQAGGQILTQLENADVALKRLKTTMQTAFDYAGCDNSGSNCAGPRRVKAFKQKAGEFFDPYEAVLDEVYDALILAQSLGVDISDIYMMLNGSCNVWGKYMCEPCGANSETSLVEYKTNAQTGESQAIYHYCQMDTDSKRGYFDVAKDCSNGTCRVSSKQNKCTLLQMLTDQTVVQQNWLDMDAGSSGGIRVACASDALENSVLFRNRKKQATIDIETLRRMLDQEAPSVFPRSANGNAAELYKFCNVGDGNSNDGREILERLVQNKRIPDGSTQNGEKLCLNNLAERGAAAATSSGGGEPCEVYCAGYERWIQSGAKSEQECVQNCKTQNTAYLYNCENSGGKWLGNDCQCPPGTSADGYRKCSAGECSTEDEEECKCKTTGSHYNRANQTCSNQVGKSSVVPGFIKQVMDFGF